MKKIVAIYEKKVLDSYWGFKFNTEIQSHVEHFMNKIHVGSNDYFLCFEDEIPNKAIITEITVQEFFDENKNLIDVIFIF
jgi:hypothetical protein